MHQRRVVDRLIVAEIRDLLEALSQHKQLRFSSVVVRLLQAFILRETNVKDICVEFAKSGRIENTWGAGNRKPQDADTIRLCASA